MELLSKLVLQVFIYILPGFFLNRIASKNIEKFIDIFISFAIYFLIPFFILSTIWAAPISFLEANKIVLVAILVFVTGTLLARVWSYYKKIPFNRHCLPIVFMNSAYLAIPVNTMLWGNLGAVYTIIFNATFSVFNYTFGIWWISDKKPVAEVFKLPFIYSLVAGITLNILSVHVPDMLLQANKIVSSFTLPVMLLLVGYGLKEIKPAILADSFIAGVVLRMAGGFAAAALFIYIFKVTDPVMRGVCVMTSSMPPAINNFILAKRYNLEVEFTSACIFLGTIFTLITIPILSFLYR